MITEGEKCSKQNIIYYTYFNAVNDNVNDTFLLCVFQMHSNMSLFIYFTKIYLVCTS